MSKFSRWCKKTIGEKAYNVVANPVKKIVKKEAIKIKAPTDDLSAYKIHVYKIPINWSSIKTINFWISYNLI